MAYSEAYKICKEFDKKWQQELTNLFRDIERDKGEGSYETQVCLMRLITYAIRFLQYSDKRFADVSLDKFVLITAERISEQLSEYIRRQETIKSLIKAD